MATKSINLLINRLDYQKIEKQFQKFRTATLIFGVVVLVFVVGAFAYIATLNKRANDLTAEKEQLTEATRLKIEREGELNYVAKKVNLMDSYLKDDAHSLPYYNVLVDSLRGGSESAKLTSFLINEKRDAQFAVGFNNPQDMLNFFRLVESDEFLKNFEKLTLSSFKSQAKTTEADVNNFTLSFDGTFVPLSSDHN